VKGLITRRRSPTVCKRHGFGLILMGNRPEGLIQKLEKEEDYITSNDRMISE
jgi:hypothetical protein